MEFKGYTLGQIFKQYKAKVSFTFFLLALENGFKVIQPFVLGLAINDLLEKTFDGLILFAILYLISFFIGIFRRYFDTRVYTKIYSDLATSLSEQQFKHHVSISTISARSSLVKELIDFFEQDLPQAFAAIIQVIGSVVMLYLFDFWVFLACLVCILLIYIIYAFSSSIIYKYNTGFNDEYEKRLDILKTKDVKQVRSHFNSISDWMIKLSNLEVVNFGIIEFILLALSIFTLVLASQIPNVSPGEIFSIMTYVLEFSQGVFLLPFLYQQVIRLKEISERLKTIS